MLSLIIYISPCSAYYTVHGFGELLLAELWPDNFSTAGLIFIHTVQAQEAVCPTYTTDMRISPLQI